MILLPALLEDPNPHRWTIIACTEFVCLVLILMFWGGPLRGIATRTLGAIIFIAYVIYLVAEVTSGRIKSLSPGEPSARDALIGLLIYGGPARCCCGRR